MATDEPSERADAASGPDPGAPPAQPRRRRLWRFVRVGLVLVLVLAIAGYALRNRVVAPAALRLAAPALAERGLTVEVDRFAGSWFSSLHLEGVFVQSDGSGMPELDLGLDRMTATFGLWSLLRGRLDDLQLEAGPGNVRATLASAEAAPAETGEPSATPGGDGVSLSVPATLPNVRLTDVALRLSTRDTVEDGAAPLLAVASADLTLREGSLVLAARDLEVRGRRAVRLDLDGRLSPQEIELDAARLDSEFGPVVALDVRIPLAGDLLRNLRVGSLQADLQRLDVVLWGADDAPQHRVLLAGTFRDRTLETERLKLTVGGGELEAARARWTLPGPTDSSNGTLDVDGRFAFDDMASLGALVDPESRWQGRLEGELRLTGPVATPTGVFRLEGRNVVLHDQELGHVDVRGELERGELRLEELTSIGTEHELRAQGRLDLAEQRFAGLELELFLDAPPAEGGDTPPTNALPALAILGGTRALRARATLDGAFGAPEGPMELEARRLVLGERSLGAIRAHGRLTGAAFAPSGAADEPEVAVELAELTLEPSASERLTARGLTFAAARESQRFACRELELLSPAGTYRLAAPARVERLVPSGHVTGSLALDGPGGGHVELELAPLQPQLHGQHARLIAVNLHLTPWLRLVGDDVLRGFSAERLDANLTGTFRPSPPFAPKLKDFKLEGELEIRSVSWADTTSVLDFHAGIGLWNESLVLQAAELRDSDGKVLNLDASLPIVEPSRWKGELFSLELDVPETDLSRWSARLATLGVPSLSGRGALSLYINGAAGWANLVTELHLDQVRVDGPDASASVAPELFERLRSLGETSLHTRSVWSNRLDLQSLALQASGPGLALQGSARVESKLVPRDLLQGRMGFLDGALEGSLQAEARDLARLPELSGAVEQLEGALQAEIELGGTLRRPTGSGVARLRDAGLRLSGSLPALRQIQGEVQFDPEGITVEAIDAELGGAPLRLSGTLDAEGGEPRVDAKLSGENLLLARGGGVKLRVDVDLDLVGALAAPHLSGELLVAQGKLVKRFAILETLLDDSPPPSGERGLFAFSLAETPLADMTFDVHVGTREPFLIQNSLVRGGLRPDLHLGGTGAAPRLEGPIYLDPTRITLPGGRLSADSGTLLFTASEPFLPSLVMHGQAELLGYSITVTTTGPYDRAEVSLSSVPPLPPDELMLLVFAGQPPSSQGGSSSDAVKQVGLFLARDFLGRWFADESTEGEASFLERFELVTGRDVSSSGTETTEASFRMLEDWVGREERWYLVAERDVYSHTNYGVKVVFRFP